MRSELETRHLSREQIFRRITLAHTGMLVTGFLTLVCGVLAALLSFSGRNPRIAMSALTWLVLLQTALALWGGRWIANKVWLWPSVLVCSAIGLACGIFAALTNG